MVDWHCRKFLLAWSAAANDENKSMGKIAFPAVELTVIAAMDDSAGQVGLACSDLVEVVGCAFLPYSAVAGAMFGAAW